MVCLKNICINTLHKGDNDDDDDGDYDDDGDFDDDNNNNLACYLNSTYYEVFLCVIFSVLFFF